MQALSEAGITCPYCGEWIELTVDCSVEEQEYIEDCAVCCRPITLRVRLMPDGSPEVMALTQDEY